MNSSIVQDGKLQVSILYLFDMFMITRVHKAISGKHNERQVRHYKLVRQDTSWDKLSYLRFHKNTKLPKLPYEKNIKLILGSQAVLVTLRITPKPFSFQIRHLPNLFHQI